MSNIFLASDYHFHHSNILNFTKSDGSPLRVFDDVNHMNEYMLMRHNMVVSPKSKIYMLGDITMGKNAKALGILNRMNGEKILIKGNHDLGTLSTYSAFFKDIRGSHQLDGMLLTHIPIHPESLSRWKVNIHGHLHANRVMLGNQIDPRYYSVCMEQLDDYTPISLEELKKRLKSVLES
jgi:calcineurin-like phosphoesterase family protein